jgi:hypothetical protein
MVQKPDESSFVAINRIGKAFNFVRCDLHGLIENNLLSGEGPSGD